MSTKTVTPGRIVNYKFGPSDLNVPAGGNTIQIGDVYPAIVQRVWGDNGCCNLLVFIDGPTPHWVTSRNEGDGEGQWSWPQTSPKQDDIPSPSGSQDDQGGQVNLYGDNEQTSQHEPNEPVTAE